MEKSVFEMMVKKEVHTQNGPVAYWISDVHSEITLVFLHGLSADHTLFERQIPYFEGRYNLFCWDAPAHGSSRPYRDFSYSRAAENLKEILQKEQLKNLVFIGQSMGGYIAQTYMKQSPDEIIGFVGIDTCPYGLSYYTRSDKWWLRQIEWICMCFPHKVLIRAIAKSCTYTEAACQNMLSALRPYSKKELCRLLGIGFAGFLEENCDLLISCPSVILVGEQDKTGKVRQYCEAWSRRTHFPLHIIPKAAHNSNYDNSELVNRQIETFLRAIIRDTSIVEDK